VSKSLYLCGVEDWQKMLKRDMGVCANSRRYTSISVKGRVVFFRKGREKISTLKPLTDIVFSVHWLRRQRGAGTKFQLPAAASLIVRKKAASLDCGNR